MKQIRIPDERPHQLSRLHHPLQICSRLRLPATAKNDEKDERPCAILAKSSRR
ncbi:hypothetical protein [uncultured Parabacteroides sp.]|uniref:hypothetical protein n=1 Tax=uncultured Parabacteroides sp. TaxID=512312 RepID=UPI00260454C1|nr:hypothetical protein [uncultured Parabacteroides sp.]